MGTLYSPLYLYTYMLICPVIFFYFSSLSLIPLHIRVPRFMGQAPRCLIFLVRPTTLTTLMVSSGAQVDDGSLYLLSLISYLLSVVLCTHMWKSDVHSGSHVLKSLKSSPDLVMILSYLYNNPLPSCPSSIWCWFCLIYISVGNNPLPLLRSFKRVSGPFLIDIIMRLTI